MADGRQHILSHSGSVTPGSVSHSDAATTAVVEVDMVGADGGGSDKTHTATLKQRGITTGTSAHKQRVGISHRRSINLRS